MFHTVLSLLFSLGLIFLIILPIARRFRKKSSNFYQELSEFLAQDSLSSIINQDQIQAMLLVSKRQTQTQVAHSSSKSALGIGVFFILGGLSLLIQHNWDSITAPTRVFAFVSAYAILSWFYLTKAQDANWKKYSLDILLFFMPILGIALYGQTFHLSGDPIRPYLIWAALVAPFVYSSRSPVLPYFLAILLLTILMIGNFFPCDLNLLNSINPLPLVLTAFAWCATAWCFRQMALAVRPLRFVFFAAWIFQLFALETPLHLSYTPQLILLGMSLSIVTLLLSIHELGLKKHVLPAWIWILQIYALTFVWHFQSSPWTHSSRSSIAGLSTLGILTIVTIYFVCTYSFKSLTQHRNTLVGIKVSLLASMALCALFFLPYSAGLFIGISTMANMLLFVIALCLLYLGKHDQNEFMIHVGLGVLVLLLITRFIDIFGDMILSGTGLVVSGLLLIALGSILKETKQRLT